MFECQKLRPAYVIGPLGERMTMDDLPPRDTRRWVSRRKAEVVAAVDGGMLTFEEACERYNLTDEELVCWQRGLERSGMLGLRATRAQDYRRKYEKQNRY